MRLPMLGSVILNVLESPGIANGLAESVSIFDVTPKIADPRVKNIVKRVLP